MADTTLREENLTSARRTFSSCPEVAVMLSWRVRIPVGTHQARDVAMLAFDCRYRLSSVSIVIRIPIEKMVVKTEHV